MVMMNEGTTTKEATMSKQDMIINLKCAKANHEDMACMASRGGRTAEALHHNERAWALKREIAKLEASA